MVRPRSPATCRARDPKCPVVESVETTSIPRPQTHSRAWSVSRETVVVTYEGGAHRYPLCSCSDVDLPLVERVETASAPTLPRPRLTAGHSTVSRETIVGLVRPDYDHPSRGSSICRICRWSSPSRPHWRSLLPRTSLPTLFHVKQSTHLGVLTVSRETTLWRCSSYRTVLAYVARAE